jgi:hypothetical protein
MRSGAVEPAPRSGAYGLRASAMAAQCAAYSGVLRAAARKKSAAFVDVAERYARCARDAMKDAAPRHDALSVILPLLPRRDMPLPPCAVHCIDAADEFSLRFAFDTLS